MLTLSKVLQNTLISDNVNIQDGCKVGVKGFGFIPLKNKNFKMPHIGKVIIDDYVEIADNSSLDLANSYTITAWIKADSDVTDWRGIVAKRNATASSNYLIYVNKTTGVLGGQRLCAPLLGGSKRAHRRRKTGERG